MVLQTIQGYWKIMNGLGAWLARSEFGSQNHMWTQNNKRVSVRSSQMDENDTIDVNIFNG